MQDANNPAPRPHWLQVVLIGRRPKNTLLRIIGLSVICIVTFKFVLLPIRVEGISMQPTYRDHQINCVNRLAYRHHEPQRGDVVSIRFSKPEKFSDPSEMLMKRIIGLPGETVSFHKGHVFINGKLLEEPYVKFLCDWEHEPMECGPTEYYVVGDNRSMPFNYHTQGRVEREHIIGRVLL